jgi:hypothetical protein
MKNTEEEDVVLRVICEKVGRSSFRSCRLCFIFRALLARLFECTVECSDMREREVFAVFRQASRVLDESLG